MISIRLVVGEGDVRLAYYLTPAELKSQLKPDLAHLKVGAKVWIEWEVIGFSDYLIDLKQDGKLGLCRHTALPSNIVAHFPSKPEKKEEEIMRKVGIYKLERPVGSTKSIEVKEAEGIFIQYGYDCIEGRDGNAMFSTGIVELPDGTIRNVPVEMLRFIEEKP